MGNGGQAVKWEVLVEEVEECGCEEEYASDQQCTSCLYEKFLNSSWKRSIAIGAPGGGRLVAWNLNVKLMYGFPEMRIRLRWMVSLD